jgi:hypothetical protein
MGDSSGINIRATLTMAFSYPQMQCPTDELNVWEEQSEQNLRDIFMHTSHGGNDYYQ